MIASKTTPLVVDLSKSFLTATDSGDNVIDLDVSTDSEDLSLHQKPPATSIGSGGEIIVLDDAESVNKVASSGTRHTECVVLDDSDDESSCSTKDIACFPKASAARRQLFNDSQDEVEVLENLSAPVSRRKKRSSTGSSGPILLVLNGLYQYDADYFKDLTTLWKKLYQNHKAAQNGDFAASCESHVTQFNEFPLVHRDRILWWLITLQLRNILVQVVRETTTCRTHLNTLLQDERPSFSTAVLSPTRPRSPSVARSESVPTESRKRAPNSHRQTPDTSIRTGLNQHTGTARNSNTRLPPRTLLPPGDSDRDRLRLARLARFDNQRQSSNETPSIGTPAAAFTSTGRGRSNATSSMGTPAAAVQVSTGWSCGVCTLQNSSERDVCLVCCVGQRPAGMTAKPPPADFIQSVPQVSHGPRDYSTPASSIGASGGTGTVRRVKCGACGQVGHNRASANEHNCPRYFDEAEVERRRKIREKKQREAQEARDSIANLQRNQATVASRVDETRRALAALEEAAAAQDDLGTNEIKRLERKRKLAEKQANKYR